MLEYQMIQAWTFSRKTWSWVGKAKTKEDLFALLEEARRKNLTVNPRGQAYSYADMILNHEQAVIDLRGMAKILSWDPKSGVLRAEPGVTFAQALEQILPDGWVVPCVPGTRQPTLGGGLSNNVHGKNAWKEGTIGEWVLGFKLLTADGTIQECRPDHNRDLFFSAINGLGLLGIFTEIILQCKKIPSPYLEVRKWTVRHFDQVLSDLEREREISEYNIGWVDCFCNGNRLGRGTLHAGSFVPPERVSREKWGKGYDYTSSRLLGVVPREKLWRLIRPFFGNRTMRVINSAKYWVDVLSRRQSYLQNYFKFNFLLDSMPNWRVLYLPHGYVEHESVVPTATAAVTFKKLMKLGKAYHFPSYLTAIKNHRRDDFVLSYSLDGYTFGIDVPIEPSRRKELEEYFFRLNETVLEGGGRIYLAKDELLTARHFVRMFPRWKEFLEVKAKFDPGEFFQSDMYRRLFKEACSL